MIDAMDIYRALKLRIGATYPSILVQIKDIKNPQPPCFYIKYIADNTNIVAGDYEQTAYSFAIYYFSGSETLLDLLEKKEALKTAFKKPLKVIGYNDNENVNYMDLDSYDNTLDEDEYILTVNLNFTQTQKIAVERYEPPIPNNNNMEQLFVNDIELIGDEENDNTNT